MLWQRGSCVSLQSNETSWHSSMSRQESRLSPGYTGLPLNPELQLQLIWFGLPSQVRFGTSWQKPEASRPCPTMQMQDRPPGSLLHLSLSPVQKSSAKSGAVSSHSSLSRHSLPLNSSQPALHSHSNEPSESMHAAFSEQMSLLHSLSLMQVKSGLSRSRMKPSEHPQA